MAAPSTIAGQIGFADEVTPGLAVTPTLFLPVIEETVERTDTPLESDAIRANRRLRDEDESNGGNIEVAGSVNLELSNRGDTKILKHIFGGAPTTTGSGPYEHTFTLKDSSGITATLQAGVPGVNGTVYAKTSTGCKVSSAEVAGSVGEIVTLGTEWVGMRQTIGSRTVADGVLNSTTTVTSANANFTEADRYKPISATGIPAGAYIATVVSESTILLSAAATATATGVSVVIGKALASASYPADRYPYKMLHAYLTIGGTAYDMTAFTLGIDNQIEARYFAGDACSKEPMSNGNLAVVGGTVGTEFGGTDLYDRYLSHEKFALVIGLSNGADSIVFTTNSRFTPGGSPNIAGRGRVMQDIPFTCLGSGTDASGITCVATNSDSTS